MDFKKNIYLPKKLITLRKSNGLTQAFVADKLSITRSTYSYYETGKTEPSFMTLYLLAKMYNVSTDVFLNCDNDIIFSDSKDKPKSFKPTTRLENLEQAEKELIVNFRLATPAQRRKALKILETQKTTSEEK